MDYNMLVGSKGVPGAVSTWTNNSRIAQDIPEIVLEAESWIYRRLRHWRMISAPLLGTLTVGADFIALPSDLLEPSFLTLTGVFQQEIYQRTAQDVMRATHVLLRPIHFAV
jgi:hypothetical protein